MFLDYVSSEMFSRKDGNVIISGVMLTEENEDGIYSLAMAALHNVCYHTFLNRSIYKSFN